MMYKLEAFRKKLGDRSLTITSGFRSIAQNNSVGGASNSMHLYGCGGGCSGQWAVLQFRCPHRRYRRLQWHRTLCHHAGRIETIRSM